MEETFQSEKGLAGLDEHQVRRYPSWARWVTLAMLAHAFLAVVRADEHAHRPTPDDLIPLTCNEIQHLFITVAVRPDHGPAQLVRLAAPPSSPSPRRPLPPTKPDGSYLGDMTSKRFPASSVKYRPRGHNGWSIRPLSGSLGSLP